MPTLGRVSDPDDVTSRLTNALDEILKGTPKLPEREPGNTRPVQDDPYDPYVLPEIVPATVEVPVAPATAPPPPPAPAPAPPAATPVAAPALAPVAPAPGPHTPVPTTAWGDHLPAQAPAAAAPPLRAPGRRPRVRKVTRVVRHVDPWSTFKLALVFSLVGYVVVLTSGVLLWRVADSTGTLDNVERWFTQFGWETFEFDGGEIFHNAWIIGLFCAVGLTGAAVLMATLFNLVSDIVGGIRVTVLEEEVVERTASSARRYVVRRPPLAGSGTAWDVDDPAPVSAPVATSVDWSIDDDEPVARSPG